MLHARWCAQAITPNSEKYRRMLKAIGERAEKADRRSSQGDGSPPKPRRNWTNLRNINFAVNSLRARGESASARKSKAAPQGVRGTATPSEAASSEATEEEESVVTSFREDSQQLSGNC